MNLSSLVALYARLGSLLDHGQSPLLLLLRLHWGYQFVLTGVGKLQNLERTAAFFADLGIPAPMINAAFAGATEAGGGALLFLGLGSRIAAVPLIGTMCVAYATAHTEELTGIFSDPDTFTSAPPFLFLLTSLVVLVFGPGRYSLDAVLAARTATTTH